MQEPDTPATLVQPSPRHRRWLLILAFIVLIAIAVGAGVGAFANYRAGVAWRQRAQSQQQRAEIAEARIAELEEETRATAGLLKRSETDVELLESRLEALASEKAGAEDTAALASEEAALATRTAQELAAVTVFATEVGGSLRDCIGRNVALTNDIIAAYNAGGVDADAFNSRIDSVNQQCADAEGEYTELLARLNAVGE